MVAKTCQQCGAVNGARTDVCCFCDAPLGALEHPSLSRRIITPTEGNLAVEPEWRREVSSRVQDYRVRRRGGATTALQTALPFDPETSCVVESTDPSTEFVPPAPARKVTAPRTQRSERFEISVPNTERPPSGINLSSAALSSPAPAIGVLTQTSVYAVASLRERRRAAIVDAGLLVFSYGGMLALFTVLGGRIGFNKVDLTVAGAVFALFYAQYFALFTVFGGSTPGMMLRGLRVVSFDGSIPASRQMVWRSFGYLISAGTCFLGFLWSLWDDDQLCWQDRISDTYLTPNEKVTPGF
jgi:uncharacterized RDD family membrane protein YckC